MLYLVRTEQPRGYLHRGRVVTRRDQATAYDSPSAALRAATRAAAAGVAEKLTPIKATAP